MRLRAMRHCRKIHHLLQHWQRAGGISNTNDPATCQHSNPNTAMFTPRLVILLASVCLIITSLQAAAAGKVRLFVLSGQSNMEYLKPDDSFTPAVQKAFPNDEVIVVHYAKGGTPMRCWWKGWTGPFDASAAGADEPPGSLYVQLMAQVGKAIENKRPDTIVFAWMQGERDAKSGLSASYEEALKGLIESVREDLKDPDMAVVIGRLSDHRKGETHWDAIRAIQEKVAAADRRGAWVDSDDLNGDRGLHCTKDGFVELGRRFAAQAVALLTRPNPQPGPP